MLNSWQRNYITMNTDPISAESRLSAGYLLWIACGAGIQLPGKLRAPWLVTSNISMGQIMEVESAVSAFRAAQDAEHAKDRAAYEDARRSRLQAAKQSRDQAASPGFPGGAFEDTLSAAAEQDLRERAQMTCQPILGEMLVTYDRLLQALQHSRYKSTALVDAGAGRAAILEGKAQSVSRYFQTDPVLRLLTRDYGETQVRSSNGGAISFRSTGRRGFYALTKVLDAAKARENLAEVKAAVAGCAVVLRGRTKGIVHSEDRFARILNNIHCRNNDPVRVQLTAAWLQWLNADEVSGLTQHVASAIERQQSVTAWDSIKALVLGVIAAERILDHVDGVLTFDDAWLDDARKLTAAAAESSYGLQSIAKAVEARALADANKRSRTTAALSVAKRMWDDNVAANIDSWADSLASALKEGAVSFRQLTRGERKILTRSQLETLLEHRASVFACDDNNMVSLKVETEPSDPVVAQAFHRLAEEIRENIDEGMAPWIAFDSPRFAPYAAIWADMVKYANGMVLKCRCGPPGAKVPVAVVLRDRRGWLAQWRYFADVVSKAEESGVQYQDNDEDDQ